MKWPYVSRRAYDLLVAENARLIAQNDKLIDSQDRLRRFEAGMSEAPRAERKPPEPMPEDLITFFNEAWGTSNTRRLQRNQAYLRNNRGESWKSIKDDIMGVDEPEEEIGDE